ncbi:hypothetical protein C8Q77DRAFT_1159831 [Trametes polyzona]|nr:hypothetical protein C8Q77DRAFT_1159831 [Trametes polyzona]
MSPETERPRTRLNIHISYPFSCHNQALAGIIMTGSIIVVNNSGSPCHLFVSKYSRPSAHDDWYTLESGQRESWARDGWELVAFKNDDDTLRKGVYVRVNSTVTFHNIGNVTVA